METMRRPRLPIGWMGRVWGKIRSAGGQVGGSLAAEVPGSAPGIDRHPGVETPPAAGEVRLTLTRYGAEAQEVQEGAEVEDLLARVEAARGDRLWINVEGLHPHVVMRLGKRFGMHTLAGEDVLKTHQRPKVEVFPDHLFVVVRMLRLVEGRLVGEQVSFFLFGEVLITFQEARGDVWDPVRTRLASPGSRLRQRDVSYLLYALLDAIVDHLFPILEDYGDHLEKIEDRIMERADRSVQKAIFSVKRELLLLRRLVWPLREVIETLRHDTATGLSAETRTFLRDVHDHCVQLMDLIETFREALSAMNELYLSLMSTRTSEVMRVLTIITCVFAPPTFLAGVYGMNFEVLPELHWPQGYLFFWLVCLFMTSALFLYLHRRGWLLQR